MKFVFALLLCAVMFFSAKEIIHINTMEIFTPWEQPVGFGLFSWYMVVGYIAIFAVCFFGLLHLLGKITLRKGSLRWVKTVLVLGIIEGLSTFPCFIGQPDALCGVLSVMIHQPVALVALVVFLYLIIVEVRLHKRRTALVIAGAIILLFAAQYQLRAPKTVEDCYKITDSLGQGNCVDVFARASNDADLCMKIDLDSGRFSCIYQVAEALRDPSLCERIENPPSKDSHAYDYDRAAQYKQTCLKLAGGK